jgi:hypothetical protein
MATAAKLYAYVDESGQDTSGRFFVASVLVREQERDSLGQQLELIEARSGKHRKKWQRARHAERVAYIQEVGRLIDLRRCLYYETFSGQTKYLALTSYTTAKATLRRVTGDYRVTVFVDGLKGAEVEVFRRGLRDLHIKTRKVRGVRSDENNSYIRLVDAICGLVRDASEGKAWAGQAAADLKQRGVLTEL